MTNGCHHPGNDYITVNGLNKRRQVVTVSQDLIIDYCVMKKTRYTNQSLVNKDTLGNITQNA